MNHLSQSELQELRDALKKEYERLLQELSEHGQLVDGNWQGIAKGFDGNEADETDEADKMEELATNISLVETLEPRLKEVALALKNMDEGTYGMTEEGTPIPLARLRANPAARTNI